MPTQTRKVRTFDLTSSIQAEEYSELRADPDVKVISQQDFGLKDQIMRVVDFKEREASAVPVEPEPYVAPIC